MMPRSALLTASGYLRVSADLLPPMKRKRDYFYFFQRGFAQSRRIELYPLLKNEMKEPWPKRKAIYGNGAARSPFTSVKALLKFTGIPLPEESVEFPVRKKKDGWLIVQL